MRMLTKKSMIKIIVALIIDNFDNFDNVDNFDNFDNFDYFDYFDYFDNFDFQLLLGWVWVAREQILRRAR